MLVKKRIDNIQDKLALLQKLEVLNSDKLKMKQEIIQDIRSDLTSLIEKYRREENK